MSMTAYPVSGIQNTGKIINSFFIFLSPVSRNEKPSEFDGQEVGNNYSGIVPFIGYSTALLTKIRRCYFSS